MADVFVIEPHPFAHPQSVQLIEELQAEYLVRYGDPFDYAGSDLLAAWYQRNIRIYRNIVALIDSPSDRILVIYGSGHLGWLRQNVSNDQSVQLRKLGDFISK